MTGMHNYTTHYVKKYTPLRYMTVISERHSVNTEVLRMTDTLHFQNNTTAGAPYTGAFPPK